MAPHVPLLTAHRLAKSFGPRTILDGVSLTLAEGERAGLLGINGSGKSTLARILAGIDPPDDGTVSVRRDLDVAYLAQEPVLEPDLTADETVTAALARWRAAMAEHTAVSEALAHGNGDHDALAASLTELVERIERLGGWDMSHRVRALLAAVGIRDPSQTVGTMSGGERRRVALARLLVARPGLAILDEPTNHLDADTVEWLEDHLVEDFPGAVLFVTHDRYFLDRVVTRVFELDRGKLSTFEGNYERYLELKADRLAHEARVEANRLNILRRERDWLSRSAPARTRKQSARIQRALALEDETRTARRTSTQVSFALAGADASRKLIEAKGLGARAGDRTLFQGLDLVLAPGERLGILGRNGAGKTTLARMLLGMQAPDEGEVLRSPRARTMYFDQQRAGLDESKTVWDNVSEGNDKVRVGGEWIGLHGYLERFLFDGSKQRQAVASLSGGERARLALARMLRGDANVVVLDEPTNDLDLDTLALLEEMLSAFDGCVLLITHDRAMLDRLATATLVFEGDGRVVRYAGGYEDYRAQRALAESRAAGGSVDTPTRTESVAPAARKKKTLTMAETRELEELPAKIDAAEHAVAQTESVLHDPGLYAKGPTALATATSAHDTARAALDALMVRWETLETKAAGG